MSYYKKVNWFVTITTVVLRCGGGGGGGGFNIALNLNKRI